MFYCAKSVISHLLSEKYMKSRVSPVLRVVKQRDGERVVGRNGKTLLRLRGHFPSENKDDFCEKILS